MKLDFNKQGGLIPTIIIDHKTKDVLMLAYMNEESYRKTLETGQTWFYSRSRNELWHKGATSGACQNVIKISTDCDYDTLLISVEQIGGSACHTGAYSCFFHEIPLEPVCNLQFRSILAKFLRFFVKNPRFSTTKSAFFSENRL